MAENKGHIIATDGDGNILKNYILRSQSKDGIVNEASTDTNGNVVFTTVIDNKKPNNGIDSYSDEELDKKIDSIDEIKDSPWVIARDAGVDLTSGAVLGMLLGSIFGSIKSRKAVKSLSEGVDDALGNQARVTNKSKAKTKELNRAMQENSHAATEAVRDKKAGKALPVIINNRIIEAKIGPEYVDDIANILSKSTGKTTRTAKKEIENWLKKHADDTNLLSLIEAKDNTTFAHSTRVGELTKQVALEAGLDEKAAEKLGQAAFLHDIGKIATPDRILSSTANGRQHPEILDWLRAHPNLGYEILEGVDDTAAGIAKGHHPKYDTTIVPTKDTNIVTISDIYDAITDQGRNYRGGAIHDKNFALNDPKGIQWNINNGETTWEYLELLRRLDEKGLLKEYYPVESELTDAFNTLKANFLKDTIRDTYSKAGAINGAIAGANIGLGMNFTNESLAMKAKENEKGLQSTGLPTGSELLSAFIPMYRAKTEKLADIKRWYKNGLLNDEQKRLIEATDLNSNKEVTKLWKELNKSFQ